MARSESLADIAGQFTGSPAAQCHSYVGTRQAARNDQKRAEVPPVCMPPAMLVSAVLVLLLLLVFGMGRWGRGLFPFPSTLNVEDLMPSSPTFYEQTLLAVSSSTSCVDVAGCNLRASFRFSA
jgi:hypothetical protein